MCESIQFTLYRYPVVGLDAFKRVDDKFAHAIGAVQIRGSGSRRSLMACVDALMYEA